MLFLVYRSASSYCHLTVIGAATSVAVSEKRKRKRDMTKGGVPQKPISPLPISGSYSISINLLLLNKPSQYIKARTSTKWLTTAKWIGFTKES